MTITVKSTGEVIDLADGSLPEIMGSYRYLSDYIKTLEQAKKELAKQAEQFIDEHGKSPEVDGYMFRQMSVQRMTYDKSVLRNVLDEDTYDLMVIPDKKAVDTYLKEHLEDLGENSTLLRQSMIPQGKAYSVTKLERLS